MNAGDDLAAAHAQRRLARRALAEADAALARLNEARERAEALLRRRRAAGEPSGADEPAEAQASPEPTGDALGRRMRHIEDRMQKTDTRMRIADTKALRAESECREHECREDERREGEHRDEGGTSSPGQRR